MTNLTAAGTLLAASVDNRTLTYRLLPFGEPGRTSAGLVTASADTALDVPAAPLPVNLEHEYKRPVGTMAVSRDDAGYNATVSVARTRAGDDVLEEAAAGLRAGISVEVSNPVIRAGRLVAGKLSGAGLVVRPAFPSALLTAADCGTDPNESEKPMPQPAAPAAPAAPATPAAPAAPAEQAEGGAAPLHASQALDGAAFAQAFAHELGLTAGNAGGDAASSLRAVTEAIAGSRMDAAALDILTKADIYDATAVPQYVGELNRARRYRPRYIPLLSSQDLTSATITGWRYVTTPTVGDWDPTPVAGEIPTIPTNAVDTEPVTAQAAYLAGGHTIPRIYRDLPTPGFWESYLRESNDDFMRKLDAKALGNILNGANSTAVVAAGDDAANVWSKLILGAHWVLEFDVPEWAIVGPDLWRQACNTNRLEALDLLSSALNLEGGTLERFKLVPAPASRADLNGKVVVGTSAAATLHTLPGGPVRVEALNVQNGTIDNGVFGYWGIINHAKAGMVQVS